VGRAGSRPDHEDRPPAPALHGRGRPRLHRDRQALTARSTAAPLVSQRGGSRYPAHFFVNIPICGGVVLALGLRWLSESRDPGAGGLPDLVGVLLLAAIPALLSYAIIEGAGRGWTDPAVLGGFVLAAAGLPLLRWRAATAVRPALDLDLFRTRDFSVVNAATFLYGAAFYALLLANVLYLRTEWHHPVLRSALANTPGPLVVLVLARPAAKLAQRSGFRPVLIAGAVFWAVGAAGFALTAVRGRSGSPTGCPGPS
jgi:hypothetical protein